MASLLNKVVLITGASTGIGAHLAKHLAGFKSRLVLVARSLDRLRAVEEKCVQAGCASTDVLTVAADIGEHNDLKRVVGDAVSTFGQLDVLVNNAAAFVAADVEHLTVEGFDRSMAVNVRAPLFLSQAAMPHLKKTQGSIVNVSSIVAQCAGNAMVPYSISKAAMEHFTRLLAYEVAPINVRVNAVTVGFTLTDSGKEVFEVMGMQHLMDKALEAMNKAQPLGGICSMDDIVKAITFLASDQASAITGICMPVDRGALLGSVYDLPDEFKNTGDVNAVSHQTKMEQLKSMGLAVGGEKPKAVK